MTLQSALGLYKSIRPTDIDFDIDIVMYFGLSKSITVVLVRLRTECVSAPIPGIFCSKRNLI